MAKSSFKQIELDERKIIDELKKNAKENIDKISKNCGFSRQKVWRIIKNLEKGIKPEKIYDAAIKGEQDLGISMPIKGHASTSKDVFDNIHNIFFKEQERIDKKLEKMASDDGLYKSYD